MGFFEDLSNDMDTKLAKIPTFARQLAVIRTDADQAPTFGVRPHAAGGDGTEDGATIMPFRNRLRPSLGGKAPAVARASGRANRDGIRDIGGDIEAQRLREEDRLCDALRGLRTAYGIPAVINILETKLAEERRLAARRAPTAAAEGGRHD